MHIVLEEIVCSLFIDAYDAAESEQTRDDTDQGAQADDQCDTYSQEFED